MKASTSSKNLEEIKSCDLQFTISTQYGNVVFPEEVKKTLNKKVFSLKPLCFNYNAEISCLKLLKYMLLDSERTVSLLRNKKNSYSTSYIFKRCELISLIQRKTSILKYKLKTYYLAVYLLDHIFMLENCTNLEYEAVALVCLLLAGKSC